MKRGKQFFKQNFSAHNSGEYIRMLKSAFANPVKAAADPVSLLSGRRHQPEIETKSRLLLVLLAFPAYLPLLAIIMFVPAPFELYVSSFWILIFVTLGAKILLKLKRLQSLAFATMVSFLVALLRTLT